MASRDAEVLTPSIAKTRMSLGLALSFSVNCFVPTSVDLEKAISSMAVIPFSLSALRMALARSLTNESEAGLLRITAPPL